MKPELLHSSHCEHLLLVKRLNGRLLLPGREARSSFSGRKAIPEQIAALELLWNCGSMAAQNSRTESFLVPLWFAGVSNAPN